MPTTTPPRFPEAPPERLPWTGDDEADRLIAADPTALLIGFVLDQQITVQKAFSGPLEIRRRLGTLDPARIAAMDPEQVAGAFARPPAVHRFPRAMAERVQRLCAHISAEYGADAANIWRGVGDTAELRRRLSALPGFGDMKVRTVALLLAWRYGVRPPGWEALDPGHPTLAGVTTPEELAEYQAGKRAHKAALRAQGLAPARPGRAPAGSGRAPAAPGRARR